MTQLMAKKKITEEKIFEALKNDNKLTKEVATYMGASKERTREKLNEMYEKNLINRMQIGNTYVYFIDEK